MPAPFLFVFVIFIFVFIFFLFVCVCMVGYVWFASVASLPIVNKVVFSSATTRYGTCVDVHVQRWEPEAFETAAHVKLSVF